MFRRIAMIAALSAISIAATAATLEWQLPTTTENGEALAPGDITAVTVFRRGEPLAGLAGDATTYEVPSCRPDTYTVAATAFGLQSDPSNPVTVEIDQVGCRPKAPTGAAVR